jgi:hypothetical protein
LCAERNSLPRHFQLMLALPCYLYTIILIHEYLYIAGHRSISVLMASILPSFNLIIMKIVPPFKRTHLHCSNTLNCIFHHGRPICHPKPYSILEWHWGTTPNAL